MSTQEKIQLQLPAKHKYLSMASALIHAFLTKLDTDEQTIYNIQLAIQEVCANIVDHAYLDIADGLIIITIYLEKSTILVIEVQDAGKGFDFASIKPANLKTPHERGYGLHLIKALIDDVTYEQLSEGNRWKIKKQL